MVRVSGACVIPTHTYGDDTPHDNIPCFSRARSHPLAATTTKQQVAYWKRPAQPPSNQAINLCPRQGSDSWAPDSPTERNKEEQTGRSNEQSAGGQEPHIRNASLARARHSPDGRSVCGGMGIGWGYVCVHGCVSVWMGIPSNAKCWVCDDLHHFAPPLFITHASSGRHDEHSAENLQVTKQNKKNTGFARATR